jgi:hypothetical protein
MAPRPVTRGPGRPAKYDAASMPQIALEAYTLYRSQICQLGTGSTHFERTPNHEAGELVKQWCSQVGVQKNSAKGSTTTTEQGTVAPAWGGLHHDVWLSRVNQRS